VAGTRTSTSSFTTGITNNTTGTHQYVFFGGTKRGTGTWQKQTCGSDGTVWINGASGSWGSWHAQQYGVLRCDQDASIGSQFGTGSVQYKAVRTC
jgi:hypothetical protein